MKRKSWEVHLALVTAATTATMLQVAIDIVEKMAALETVLVLDLTLSAHAARLVNDDVCSF